MKSLIILILLIFVSRAWAQPSEEKLIGMTIDRLYKSVSFADSSAFHADSVAAVFTKDGKLTANFTQNPMTFTVNEYTDNLRRRLRKGEVEAAHEKELFRTVDVFGNAAHVLSSYELTLMIAGKPVVRRGVNFFQLLKVNGKWQINSLIWDRENERLKLPSKYVRAE